MNDDRDDDGKDEEGESPHARDKFDWATAGHGVHVLKAEDDDGDGKALSNGHAKGWES